MKDMREHLEKLQRLMAECEMIRDLATDREKRDLFAKLAEHFKVPASEIENTLLTKVPDTFLGRKTQKPFPQGETE